MQLALPTALAQAQLGDRLVIAVNQVPYSQRQVELYFTVRAGLRPLAEQDQLLVDSRNWAESLGLFTDDMLILQEAQRLGSFSAEGPAVAKFTTQLHERRRTPSAFTAALKRLGCDDQTLVRTLDSVLRVAAFRRSKNRQEAQSLALQPPLTPEQRSHGAKWLSDLAARATSRLYLGASVYQEIHPAAGRSSDGL